MLFLGTSDESYGCVNIAKLNNRSRLEKCFSVEELAYLSCCLISHLSAEWCLAYLRKPDWPESRLQLLVLLGN